MPDYIPAFVIFSCVVALIFNVGFAIAVAKIAERGEGGDVALFELISVFFLLYFSTCLMGARSARRRKLLHQQLRGFELATAKCCVVLWIMYCLAAAHGFLAIVYLSRVM